MKTFKMHLNELFDRPYRWKKESGIFFYSFVSADGGKFDVEFLKLNSNEMEYSLSFTKDDRYAATGEGDAPKVFATIFDIIKDFMKKADFEELSFEASKGISGKDSKGRVRLYKTMIQRFAKKFGLTAQVDDSDPKTTLFTLRKENK